MASIVETSDVRDRVARLTTGAQPDARDSDDTKSKLGSQQWKHHMGLALANLNTRAYGQDRGDSGAESDPRALTRSAS